MIRLLESIVFYDVLYKNLWGSRSHECLAIYPDWRCWSVRRQEIGLCLEQLRRVLVSGVSARIMQHEGIRRLRYSLARKSATPGTFHRETQPGRVPYLIARRFTSPYLEATRFSQKTFARSWRQLVWIFLRSMKSRCIFIGLIISGKSIDK